jgi:riboflavin kinase/FMN adenylyltransferase
MIELQWSEMTRNDYTHSSTAMTIGVFDGFHPGHEALLSRVVDARTELSVVVTFGHHPGEVLGDGRFPGYLLSAEQKRNRLAVLGIDIMVNIDFSAQFSQLKGTEFLSALAGSFGLQLLVIGYDFRCGHGLDTDTDAVRRFMAARGSIAEVVKPVLSDGLVVSSTRIRDLIRSGDVVSAGKLLGRSYELDMRLERVKHEDGQALCTATLNQSGAQTLPYSRQLLPHAGSYDATLIGERFRSESVITVEDNSLRWPLSANGPILYIVLKNRRFKE